MSNDEMVDKTDIPEEEDVEEEVEEVVEEQPIEEPIARRSVKDYIIERKNKKIEKLQKDNEEEDYLDTDSKVAIQKEVEDKVNPILQTVKKQSDEQEIQGVFSKYPDANKMEKEIRKYMEHPAYEKVSVNDIYLLLSAKKMNLQNKRNEANEDAKKDKTGGHGKRKSAEGKIPDVSNMSDEEFDKLSMKVKTGQF